MRLTVECPLAFIALQGLWCEADDSGVFEWKPLTLKARILPAPAINFEDLLSVLSSSNFIMAYEIGGKKYGAVRNFCRFQRPKKPNRIHPLTDEVEKWTRLKEPEFGTSSEPVPHQFPTSGEKSPQMEEGGGRMEEGEEKKAAHPGRHERFGEVVKRVETVLNCPTLTVFAEVDQWLKGGADPDTDIYPTLERLKSKWSGPSLKYFTQAIADSVATRTTPMPQGRPRPGQAPPPTTEQREAGRAAWEKVRLSMAVKGIGHQDNTPHDFRRWIAAGDITEDQARKAGWAA